MSFELSAILATWIAIGLLGLALAGVVRQVRYLSSAPSITHMGLLSGIGRPAPRLTGEAHDWAVGKPRVVLFASSKCPACDQRIADLAAVAQANPNGVQFAAIYRGSDTGEARASEIRMFADQDQAFDELKVTLTPFGLVIDGEGVIKEAIPIGSESAIRHLVSKAVAEE
jgi:thiol-disulfide isomerase/thioredoxin